MDKQRRALKNPRVAVIGATGMVGRELVRILEERSFKLSHLALFASPNSAGTVIDFKGEELVVQELKSVDQIDADLAFFGAGSKVSLAMVEPLAKKGTICIDKSSAYRMREHVPLVVPEVNGYLLQKDFPTIIASPNCVATPLVQALAPIHKAAELDQVVVATYQAVSGAGKAASDELETQVRDLFNMRDVDTQVFGKRIAFNVLPCIPARGSINHLGKTDEEVKLIEETKKILDAGELRMEATCVRVPVFNGHSMAVSLGTKRPIKVNDALDILTKAPGIMMVDRLDLGVYPTPLDASGEDRTLVGRLRENTATSHGLSLWISSDNLRTGAALNAVRIAETLMLE
ncbi:MAG TPA: aspartate-semialdehyde dehydrogenase [Myxococcota bacterium]|nr:aspartate-semialdehyde dehydrogenase [Myxococcota bacterium]